MSLPSTALILPAVVFTAGPVDEAGSGSKCQHGTSGADKHLYCIYLIANLMAWRTEAIADDRHGFWGSVADYSGF